VDLPRLYSTVQQCGGLSEVIEKKRWPRVADLMKIPRLAQDRLTKLDDIYCKYLLPYDTLSHDERLVWLLVLHLLICIPAVPYGLFIEQEYFLYMENTFTFSYYLLKKSKQDGI
jgi:ARID/BRIGHT DNA binding domain.